MYNSTKENKGNYTVATYLKRGMELTSIKLFNQFKYKYLPGGGVFLDYYSTLIRYGDCYRLFRISVLGKKTC